MRGVLKICLVVFTALVMYGCYRHNEETVHPPIATPGSAECDTVNVSYDRTVKYIFQQNCALSGCHASSAPTGGYTLDNYDGVRSIVLSGRIKGAITHASGYVPMPKDAGQLTDCQVGLILSWIDQGAKNN